MNLKLVWIENPYCTTHNGNLEQESCANQTRFVCSLVCVEIVQSAHDQCAKSSCHMHNLYCTTGQAEDFDGLRRTDKQDLDRINRNGGFGLVLPQMQRHPVSYANLASTEPWSNGSTGCMTFDSSLKALKMLSFSESLRVYQQVYSDIYLTPACEEFRKMYWLWRV